LREFFLAPCLVAVLFVDARLLQLEALDPLTGIAVDVADANRPREEVLERGQDRVGLLGGFLPRLEGFDMTDLVMSSVS
jgi:hypothetical protein